MDGWRKRHDPRRADHEVVGTYETVRAAKVGDSGMTGR